jgi:uncharacterized protein (DUF952 family)
MALHEQVVYYVMSFLAVVVATGASTAFCTAVCHNSTLAQTTKSCARFYVRQSEVMAAFMAVPVSDVEPSAF